VSLFLPLITILVYSSYTISKIYTSIFYIRDIFTIETPHRAPPARFLLHNWTPTYLSGAEEIMFQETPFHGLPSSTQHHTSFIISQRTDSAVMLHIIFTYVHEIARSSNTHDTRRTVVSKTLMYQEDGPLDPRTTKQHKSN
jgi:hypothetical protein